MHFHDMNSFLLTAALTVCPLVLQAALTDGLVAYYKFDETSGNTAVDAIRSAAGNGTLANFPGTQWGPGRIGGAVACDGTNDWITTPSSIASGATAMSFSGWVWANARPAWGSIVKNWGGTISGQFHFGLNAADGRLSNYLTNGTNVIDPTVFPTGSWQQIAFTYDGATHRVYRNGAQVGFLTTATTLVRSSPTVAFGVKSDNGGTVPETAAPGFWNGKYDDFGFWNRALTAAEVLQIYNAGLTGVGISGTTAPTIASFTASPANVPAGGTTTISWSVQNAVTVTLNGGGFTNQNVTAQTSIVTAPLAAEATFTLTATNAAGPVSADRRVGVGASVQPPLINEFLAANDTGLLDAVIDGDREDWIEIHNPNPLYSLELGGYFLTDELGNLDKWAFPSVTMPPLSYLVVFASEKNRAVAGLPLHTNFKLSENGEYLALVNPDGATIVQQFAPTFPDQSSDISYSSAGYLATPTPGAVNSAPAGPAITAVTENPVPQPLDADSLTISATLTPHGGATVTSARLIYRVQYNAEVSISMTAGAAGVFSAVIPAAASTPGQMIRWRIAAADSAGRTSKAPLFRDATNSPEYFGTVVQDPAVTSQLPIIQRFVQTPANIDNDPGTRCSLFVNGEFFDNCGIRIRGFTSRGWPKKSHKIEGNSGQRFRFKADVPRVTEFDLNTTYTDKSYVRSQLVSEMQLAVGMVSPEIFPVQVRQNGAFYSVALMVENPDTDFLQRRSLDPDGSYYKAPTNNFYDTSATFEKKTRLYESGKGDLDTLITNLALTGTALETYVFDNVDLPGMINYIATTSITQNIDASDKNHFAYRDTNNTGEWNMIPWDLDLSLGPNALNTDTIVYSQNFASHPFIGASPYLLADGKRNRFLEAIINTPRSRDMVVRRIRSLMDQYLATNWFQNRIDQLVPLLGTDVTADRAKWGSSSHFGGTTYTLLAATNRIKNEYLTPRLTWLNAGGTVGIPASQPAAPVINFGAYDANPASNNQDQEFVELINPNAFSVDVSGYTITGGFTDTLKSGTVMPAGSSLYLTPSPSAFRARTTGPRGGQRLFVQDNGTGNLSNFGETLTLKNTAGTTIATLAILPAPSDPQRFLVISEIMYHPEPDGDAEFVELMNLSPTVTLNMAGVKFSNGIDFTFPPLSTLGPLQRVLIVKNTNVFTGIHGRGLPVAGVFANLSSLRNGGETIKLDDASGSTIREFTYDDIAPWPAGADGSGSLVLIAPLTNPDHNLPQNWRTSMTLTGNPNADDLIRFTGTPGGDDNNNGWTNLLEYTFGANPLIRPVLTPEGLTITLRIIPHADDAAAGAEVSADLNTWVAAEFISSDGITQTYRIPPALAGGGRCFVRGVTRLR